MSQAELLRVKGVGESKLRKYGEEILEPKQHTERIRIGGHFVERTLTRSEKIEDNDLPVIAEKYRDFLKEHDGCASKMKLLKSHKQ